jgi:flagellin-specific chaperone FliS
MYTFFIIETIKASSSKSIKHIDDILPIVKDLRNTWAEADVLARKRN